jgi:cytidylate kinase
VNKFPLIVAIDGGSGAGKSSSARGLAERLNCLYVDSGSHYRSVTLLLQQKKIPYTDTKAIEQTLAETILDEEIIGRQSFIRLNRRRYEDVQLRSAEVNAEVSYYSTVAELRRYLLHFQRAQATVAAMHGFEGLVMEGRDIGLNIFPETPYKYFLFADQKVKMARRAREGVTDVIETRDRVDSTQGQLKEAEGAIEVDTTNRTLEEVIDWLVKDVRGKINY